MKYEKLTPTTTYGGHRLSSASSETLIHHRRQRTWQMRIQAIFCCLTLTGEQQTAFSDMAATLADLFNHFRGYVPSDILAGIALYSLHDTNVREHSQLNVICCVSSCLECATYRLSLSMLIVGGQL